MTNRPRIRFWLETVLGAMTAIVLVMTIMMPDWIERIFGFEPDAGSGSTEWEWAISLAIATVVLFADARRLWLRSAQSSALPK